MVMTMSPRVAAPLIDPTLAPPAATSASTAAPLTSKPSTWWPALMRLSAMGRPMLPSPMNPTLAMALPLFLPLARGRDREHEIRDEHCGFAENHPDAAAIDLREQELDRRHRD